MASPRRLLFSLLALTLAVGGPVGAQQEELEVQPTPFTALIDFSALRHPVAESLPLQRSLPIWMEGVQIESREEADGAARVTTFRIRLRRMAGLNDSVLLRLFFDDRPEAHPSVMAWTETGTRKFSSGPLGAGLGLPASESLVIPVAEADYLEITVPGDGAGVRQALIATARKSEVQSALDFAAPQAVADPFGAPASAPEAAGKDSFLFGRVRALLDEGPLKLDPAPPPPGEAPRSTVHFGFNLEAEPLVALVTFEILNADPTAPLMAWANGEPAGAIAPQLPDLADPGYTGVARPFEAMRFRYAGWVRCQKIIPGRLLRTGENTFTLQVPAEAGPVAIRHVELQLKNPWQKLDYLLAP